MYAEIITIGDELLIGQVIDTNSAWIAQELNHIGISIRQITSIADDNEQILTTLEEASPRADIVLITGGLGPTKDDITKNALCEYFNSTLEFNQEMYEQVEILFKNRGLKVTEVNRKQAEIPNNCIPIINKNGTAPGLWFEKNNIIFVSMPGVPYEMKAMMENEVLPKLKKVYQLPSIVHKTILTQGIGESYLSAMIREWEEKLPLNIHLAYLPSPGIVRLRLSGYGEKKKVIEESINIELDKLKSLIKDYIFGYDKDTLEEIIGNLLKDKKKNLAVAESCTGGYISHLITSVPGSSQYFKGAVIAYDNKIKINDLGVDANDIELYGAVSAQVVEQMALGIQKKYQSDFSISTSGIAGPSGGSIEKPVGTVFIAVAGKGRVISKKFLLGDHRQRNIQKASIAALNMLRKEILSATTEHDSATIAQEGTIQK